jgi:hypothetical protein
LKLLRRVQEAEAESLNLLETVQERTRWTETVSGTVGTGQIGRRDFADGYFAEDKPNSMNAGEVLTRLGQ